MVLLYGDIAWLPGTSCCFDTEIAYESGVSYGTGLRSREGEKVTPCLNKSGDLRRAWAGDNNKRAEITENQNICSASFIN